MVDFDVVCAYDMSTPFGTGKMVCRCANDGLASGVYGIKSYSIVGSSTTPNVDAFTRNNAFTNDEPLMVMTSLSCVK